MISFCGLRQILDSSSRQQQLLSMRVVVDVAEADGEQGEEENRLFLLVNNISGDIYNTFLDYKRLGGKGYILEESITQLAHLDS